MPSHVSNLEAYAQRLRKPSRIDTYHTNAFAVICWVPSSYKIHHFKKKRCSHGVCFENKQYRHWFNECRFAGWYSFWLDMLWSACNSCDGFGILGPLELQCHFGWFTGQFKRAWKYAKCAAAFRASAKIFRTSRWMSKFSVSVFCDFAVFVGMCMCIIYIYIQNFILKRYNII